MPFETLRYERDGPLGVMTLDRPDRLNAINARMVDELLDCLAVAERDEGVRAIVLTGAGRAFSAGFDLKESLEKQRRGVGDWQPVLEHDLSMIMAFWRCAKPTVAAVHGYCIAGGMELALACDITIAAEGTRFGEPELKFGAGIVALLLPWFAGPKKAKEWLLTGNDRIDARAALDWGLINDVVPEDQHLEAALRMARQIAVMDADAVRMTKSTINRVCDIMGMRDALGAGLDACLHLTVLDTPERRQFNEIASRDGLKAALAWRESRFNQD